MTSQLAHRQERTYGPRPITIHGRDTEITAAVRFDDRCGNGHNTFSITADIVQDASGCLHDEVARCFPELAPLIKWHLCSTDGPLHYIENTMFWLGRRGWNPPNLEHARKTALWPDLPESFVITGTSISNAIVEEALRDRLPGLLVELRAAVEALGMMW